MGQIFLSSPRVTVAFSSDILQLFYERVNEVLYHISIIATLTNQLSSICVSQNVMTTSLWLMSKITAIRSWVPKKASWMNRFYRTVLQWRRTLYHHQKTFDWEVTNPKGYVILEHSCFSYYGIYLAVVLCSWTSTSCRICTVTPQY